MAPSSLLSAVARQSTGSTLVCRWPSVASGLHSSDCASSLWFFQAPPSLRLHLRTLSLRLHLSCLSHLLHLGPLDPPRRPGSSALHLRLGLLRHRRSAPWSRQPWKRGWGIELQYLQWHTFYKGPLDNVIFTTFKSVLWFCLLRAFSFLRKKFCQLNVAILHCISYRENEIGGTYIVAMNVHRLLF